MHFRIHKKTILLIFFKLCYQKINIKKIFLNVESCIGFLCFYSFIRFMENIQTKKRKKMLHGNKPLDIF